MHREVNSVIMLPPYEGMGRRKMDLGTPFKINWPNGKVFSNWYFLTKDNRRIYLKRGWNLFGYKKTNHFIIQEPAMKSCEMNIHVGKFDWIAPKVYSVNGNCIVDGIRMNHKQICLRNKSTVGIWVASEYKLIVLKFFRSSRKH